MALIEFSHINKHGNIRTRIICLPTNNISNPSIYGKYTNIKTFKYLYKHPVLPPSIFKTGKDSYIIPTWQKVVEGTTINDITWLHHMEPIEKKENKNIWKFQSKSSPDIYYTVEKIGNKFKCDCPGFWRAKDHQCTHIQQILKIS